MITAPAPDHAPPLTASLRGASKRYPVGRRWGRSAGSIDALADVDLDVHRGEALAVVGRNGSGKSTLLRLLAGTLRPTTGEVRVSGSVVPLLELGAGFHPEYSGRENLVFYGLTMGLSRQEIRRLEPEIAAFAEIGDAIERPLKTYSAGMVARLAFAVRQVLDPDLVLIDEALGAGDVFFQQRCATRLREWLARGTSVVFVTHDMDTVRRLAHRVAVLERGRLVLVGQPTETVSWFIGRAGDPSLASLESSVAGTTASGSQQTDAGNLLSATATRFGARGLEIVGAHVTAADGTPGLHHEVGAAIRLALMLRANRPVAGPSVGLHLHDRFGTLIFACGTRQLGVGLDPFAEGETRDLEFRLELQVQAGDYTLSLGCGEPDDRHPDTGTLHDRWEGLGPIHVLPPPGRPRFHGLVPLPFEVVRR